MTKHKQWHLYKLADKHTGEITYDLIIADTPADADQLVLDNTTDVIRKWHGDDEVKFALMFYFDGVVPILGGDNES